MRPGSKQLPCVRGQAGRYGRKPIPRPANEASARSQTLACSLAWKWGGLALNGCCVALRRLFFCGVWMPWTKLSQLGAEIALAASWEWNDPVSYSAKTPLLNPKASGSCTLPSNAIAKYWLCIREQCYNPN